LNLGGSLQELRLNNNAVIKDLYPLKYDATYAIFFPFANRIADGTYVFNFFLISIKKKKTMLYTDWFTKKHLFWLSNI
jgi:hypothetical protein|tara:strand:+ start:1966 stop:2199 length:234 start_codon:yes stop_codon:yes gene_type:complete